MNVVIRGFKRGTLIFQQRMTMSDDAFALKNGEFQGFARSLAEQHVRAMDEGRIGMIEIEFCDAPELERFLRIGIEPHGMVVPIGIDIDQKGKD